jgi:hypothetical protein
MFRSLSYDHHQGVNHRTCANPTYWRACLVIFQSVAVCCRCVCAYDVRVPFRVVSGYFRVVSGYVQYITRHHTERYIIRTDTQTTYSHRLEYNEASTPISRICTSTVIDP